MFRKAYRENHENNMKLFNKKGMLDDVFDLMAFVLIAVFSLFFIYAALVSSIDARDRESLDNLAMVGKLHNNIIAEQEYLAKYQTANIPLLVNQLDVFTATEIPGVKEYSEAELAQLLVEAKKEQERRRTVQVEREFRTQGKQ